MVTNSAPPAMNGFGPYLAWRVEATCAAMMIDTLIGRKAKPAFSGL